MDNIINEFYNNARNLTVLYVEDDKFMREVTTEILEKYFFKLFIAKNGKEGLDIYSKEEIDIVITDIHMPEMNGFEMAKKIKSINYSQNIVVISSVSDQETLLDFIEVGIDSFIVKPLRKKKIMTGLSKICKNIVNDKILEKLRERKIVDSFVVTANHEINQSLTAIKGYIELCKLSSEYQNLKKVNRFIAQISKATMKIDDILKKFRELKDIKYTEYLDGIEMIEIHDVEFKNKLKGMKK